MSTAVVTGAGGLVGSEAAEALADKGFDVVAIDNDTRAVLFGPDASTRHVLERLAKRRSIEAATDIDIRDNDAVRRLFRARSIDLVVHCAAQPSHEWAATDPETDFAINAVGTLNLLEASRQHAPATTFVFVSTNKVYGDHANGLPFEEHATRYELPVTHPWYSGIDTSMSLDRTTHSLFGVSKTAADLLVQEYGRYFGLATVCFRAGCISGPNHAGAQLHGFLAYLMRCTATGTPYTVYGYNAKQVRDTIHSRDIVDAFLAFHAAPRVGAVYNIGGGRTSNCSMLEAIALCEQITGRQLEWTLADEPRVGDHRWWISDVGEFRADHPDWEPRHDVEAILREIHAENVERWAQTPASAR